MIFVRCCRFSENPTPLACNNIKEIAALLTWVVASAMDLFSSFFAVDLQFLDFFYSV